MQKFKTINDVIALAEFAHRNQTDHAGLPYIEHPRRVMENVRAQGALPYVQMAAILHDVTEDTAFTPQMLLDLGVPAPAVEIVRLVDRNINRPDRWYDYMNDREWKDIGNSATNPNFSEDSKRIQKRINEEFYYSRIKAHPSALQVKLADISDNLQPWRMSYLSLDKQEYLKAKYARAHQLLGV
jgi:(p)ppGpp synthase/HD superfamily hydrolase